METAEIRANHKILHDNLSNDYYQKHLMSKEAFDYYHGQNWIEMEDEITTASDYVAPIPPRDLAREIDELKAQIAKLIK